MYAILVLNLLGSPDYEAREAAERAGRLLDGYTLTQALTNSEDPETRVRLQRLIDRQTFYRIDSLLPDWHPYWPDRDSFRDFLFNEADEERLLFPLKGLGDPEWRGVAAYYALVEYRRASRIFLTRYIHDTGDWCGAEAMLLNACEYEMNPIRRMIWDEERGSDSDCDYTYEQPRDPVQVQWNLWWYYPDLLKGYYANRSR